MPSASDFRKAFKLSKADKIAGIDGKYAIQESHVGHEVRQENERYEFPTQITVLAKGANGRQVLQVSERQQWTLDCLEKLGEQPEPTL